MASTSLVPRLDGMPVGALVDTDCTAKLMELGAFVSSALTCAVAALAERPLASPGAGPIDLSAT